MPTSGNSDQNPTAAPADSNLASIAKYRKKAAAYNDSTGRTHPIRVRTIDLLDLQPGQTVLDTGCGTGKSFEMLLERVGPEGLVVGVDQSPEMIAIARTLVSEKGWTNVMVIEGFMETVKLPVRFDAILFHYTHDILRVQGAVDNLFSHVKPGARVAVAGMKYFPWWTGPLNLYAFFKNYAWNGNASGMWRPWSLLREKLSGWSMTPTQFGMGYIGSGRYKGQEDE
ncbi:MAG: class I SAM-dependent methyltransferase [Burkholderiaceae bacterium]